MAFTGQLGTSNSELGNIILAFGTQVAGQIAFQGVPQASIGDEYDFAMGYDPGTGTATMYGYVLEPGQSWEETTQLADVQRLIQSAAGSSTTDRDLTRWPKVAQGDWSKGERQLVFSDASRYYQTDGNLDVTQVGNLTIANQPVTNTYTSNGTYNLTPLVSDGVNWYAGVSSGANNLLIGNASGITAYNVTGGEILDMIATPYGIFYGTATKICSVNSSGTATEVLTSQEGISASCFKSFAYFGNKLWFIKSDDTVIKSIPDVSASSATAYTTQGKFETHITAIGPTSNGFMYASYREITGTNFSQVATLYSSSGTAPDTQIGHIPGKVLYIAEINGTVYILAKLAQATGQDLVLYDATYNGTIWALAVVDDMRSALSDFQANNPSPNNYQRCSMWGDGRFIYIAWPGLQGLKLDLVTGGISEIGGNGGSGSSNIIAHRMTTCSSVGLVDIKSVGSTVTVNAYSQSPITNSSSGFWVSSYYDFNTPSLVKYFRTIEFELVNPLPAGSSLAVSFSLDAANTYTPLSLYQTQTNVMTGFLPSQTRGYRVRFKTTLTAGAGGIPAIRAVAIKANLGRVWKIKASCKQKQQLRNGQEDQQGLFGKDLLSQFQNAYSNAQRVALYIPSPKQSSLTEQVWAVLEDYTFAASSPAPRQSEQRVQDIEGVISATLTETLG